MIEIDYSTTGNDSKVVEYIYYAACTTALASGLFLVSQTTIVVVYAAAKALKGNNPDVVLEVVSNIQDQQQLIFKAGIIVITSLWIHCIAMIWSKSTTGVSGFCTFLYIVCYAFIMAVTYQYYWLFHPYQKKGEALVGETVGS